MNTMHCLLGAGSQEPGQFNSELKVIWEELQAQKT